MHYRSMKGGKINLYKKKVVLLPNKLVVTKVQWWLNLMANFVSDMHFLEVDFVMNIGNSISG